jgi:hypothetical protein
VTKPLPRVGIEGGLTKLNPEDSSTGVIKGVVVAEAICTSQDVSVELQLEEHELVGLEALPLDCVRLFERLSRCLAVSVFLAR